MVKTDNLVESPDYQTYEDYGNHTESDEGYFPPMVNCTCFRSDIEQEIQYRKKEVIKEGTIGGVPCGTTKESRTCICLNYGM